MTSKPTLPKVVLKVEDLSILRGSTQILDQLSFEVQAGEHTVLLGPNGSGKSSLIAALLGYLPASKGQIQVLGYQYGRADWRDLRCKVALVGSALVERIDPESTAFDLVCSASQGAIGRWGNPTSEQIARARLMLEQWGLSETAEREWRKLSQGERQRCLLARAWYTGAALVILDEPSAGLDPIAREELLVTLEKLLAQENAPTLLVVTHHLEEIPRDVKKAIFIKSGRLLAKGTTTELLRDQPLSELYDRPLQVLKWDEGYFLRLKG